MKILLKHLRVLTDAELNKPGCAWPWLLAARVLKGGDLLTWPELWDVLRWYAHNRGYDANRQWSSTGIENESVGSEDAALDQISNDNSATQEEKNDAEKVKAAKKLMRDLHTDSMAVTFCKVCGIDPFGTKKSTNLPGDKRPKAQNAAFPREVVEGEVKKILQAHFEKLKAVDASLEKALFSDWRTIPCPDLKPLPKRYKGGLLFGQLVPRFDNRIIARCPKSEEKVPTRFCQEFLDLRWALLLSNIKIACGVEELRRLKPDEKLGVDRACRAHGFLRYDPDTVNKKTSQIHRGRNELRDILCETTHCERHNLDDLLFDRNMREALKILPIAGSTEAFRIAWSAFDGPSCEQKTGVYAADRLAGRFSRQLFRGKKEAPRKLSIRRIIIELEKLQKGEIAAKMRKSAETAATKKGRLDETEFSKLLDAEFYLERLSGRARFGRKMMRRAFEETMRRDNPLHPLEKGGCLEQKPEIPETPAKQRIDKLSNNHLVRHRLRILVGDPNAKRKPKRGEPKQGLLGDIIDEFAVGDKRRVARVAIELARDLQEMSGKDSQERKKIHNQKLDKHEDAAAQLAEVMHSEGIPFIEADGRPRFSASLIRKARVALDLTTREARLKLSSVCPYTNRIYPLADVARGKMELDHVIPRSKRLSDALEAMVVTFPAINKEKKNKTALQFIREMNLKENEVKKQALGIRNESDFLDFVNGLWPKYDPFKRAKATGVRPTDDEIRCWRRKEFLKKEKWDDKEFKPADLTQTRYITKLATQQIQKFFSAQPIEKRPPVIPLVGAVTKAFRDGVWKLLPLLCERGEKAKNSAINAVFDKRHAELAAGREFNLKNELRSVTHLHHALDAITLALVSNTVVSEGHQFMDGQLAQWIIKRKLNADEKNRFEKLRHQLGLPWFYRWALRQDDDTQNGTSGQNAGGVICLEDLPNSIKDRIAVCLAEKRVVQHIPARMDGMPVDLNMWRLRGWKPDGKAILEKHSRDASGKRKSDTPKAGADNRDRLIGWQPENGKGKLKQLKAVLVTNENFGVALTKPQPVIIPFHKVCKKLEELAKNNDGKWPRIVRAGALIEVPNGRHKGSWRIFSIKNNANGVAFALGQRDSLHFDNSKQNVLVRQLLKDGAVFPKTPLTGIPTS